MRWRTGEVRPPRWVRTLKRMRQVTVTSPEGKGADVARIAFGAGISEVSLHKVRRLGADGSETAKDKIEIETGTALAKTFIELTTASFFEREHYTVAVRQPRSIISGERLRTLTWPLVEPGTDLFEELWQFCQVTYGFIGRIYLGA